MTSRAPSPILCVALLLVPAAACSTHGGPDGFGVDELGSASDGTAGPVDEPGGAGTTTSTTSGPGDPPGDSGDPPGDSGDPSGGSGDDSETGAATGSETGAEVTGEERYLMVCAPCHGMSGEGTALGYELQHPVREYATWVVRNGRPGEEFDGPMQAYGPMLLGDELLDEIWDYLDSFPQPTTGEELYLDYCRNCHGEDADGGVVGKSITGEGYGHILDAVREGKHTDEIGNRGHYMPAFDETELTNNEVELIADYIDTL